MTEQTQDQAADQQITVRIGFEAALDQAAPAWRETWSQVAIDNARFFYNAGVRDTSIFASSAVQNMNQAISNLQSGYQSINELAQKPQQGGVLPPEMVAAADKETDMGSDEDNAAFDPIQAEHDAVTQQADETAADLEQAQHDESQAPADVAAAPSGEAAQDALAQQSAPQVAPVEAPAAPTETPAVPEAPAVQ